MLDYDIHVQREVIVAALDDFVPDSVFANAVGAQYGNTDQRRNCAIEFVCAMLSAELIAALPGKHRYEERTPQEIRVLLVTGDGQNGFDADLLWKILYFTGTQKLEELVRASHLNSWEALQAGLSESLGDALSKMGVVRVFQQPGSVRGAAA